MAIMIFRFFLRLGLCVNLLLSLTSPLYAQAFDVLPVVAYPGNPDIVHETYNSASTLFMALPEAETEPLPMNGIFKAMASTILAGAPLKAMIFQLHTNIQISPPIDYLSPKSGEPVEMKPL